MFRRNLKALLNLDDTPERTALSFSVGVFLAFSPFIGLHAVIGLGVAFAFRLNKLAMMLGVFSNPWVLLPFYAFSTWFGMQITGMDGIELPADLTLRSIFTQEFLAWMATQWRLLIPAFLGSMILSVALGLAAYPISLRAIRKFRRSRPSAKKDAAVVS